MAHITVTDNTKEVKNRRTHLPVGLQAHVTNAGGRGGRVLDSLDYARGAFTRRRVSRKLLHVVGFIFTADIVTDFSITAD